VEKLTALRGALRFTLAFTVMRHNAHEVNAFAALGKQLGAHTVVFRPLYPAGAAKARPELLPDFAQYSDALAGLREGAVRGIDPFSPQAREQSSAEIQGNFGCGAGNTIATVSVRGDVNPCSFLGPGFDAANLREKSFHDIWHHSQGFQSSCPKPAASKASRTWPGPGGGSARSSSSRGSFGRVRAAARTFPF
jgi:MoaA/NifB/PqqE/SkfB family radical SAM enzyme